MGRPSPFPTFAEAMMEELDELAWMASFIDSLFSSMLHASHSRTNFFASTFMEG
jgi:hypothetical protein